LAFLEKRPQKSTDELKGLFRKKAAKITDVRKNTDAHKNHGCQHMSIKTHNKIPEKVYPFKNDVLKHQ